MVSARYVLRVLRVGVHTIAENTSGCRSPQTVECKPGILLLNYCILRFYD